MAPASDRPDDTSPDTPADLLDLEGAAALIGVEPSRVTVMVDDGLLTVAEESAGGPLFRRAEVEAVRLAGG